MTKTVFGLCQTGTTTAMTVKEFYEKITKNPKWNLKLLKSPEVEESKDKMQINDYHDYKIQYISHASELDKFGQIPNVYEAYTQGLKTYYDNGKYGQLEVDPSWYSTAAQYGHVAQAQRSQTPPNAAPIQTVQTQNIPTESIVEEPTIQIIHTGRRIKLD